MSCGCNKREQMAKDAVQKVGTVIRKFVKLKTKDKNLVGKKKIIRNNYGQIIQVQEFQAED